MKPLISLVLLVVVAFSSSRGAQETPPATRMSCCNVPGSPGYPTPAAWDAFNATISGRLVAVVPSAEFCRTLLGGACTDLLKASSSIHRPPTRSARWASGLFRSATPGAMNQGYDLRPSSLCLRNATSCGKGDVPVYSVEAETVGDIQAAVKFATRNNLRVAVKSSWFRFQVSDQ
ncbi:hypothetical protein B0H17DRAFT_1133949 [Mycena rosella]|uniref:FAD linked oxidase N-terminal domain-containing protein n=1 Tax=Mycena rosella TaxID=1033263 RepID=A0AAD7DHS9_MYCRO|nr:hypothetical protein B0H17DRAFT_1133949 [Mycena rosella]